MRFWDSSAIVPLLIDEPETGAMLELHRQDASILAAFITPLEVTSAVWRRLHNHLLTLEERADAESIFADLSDHWSEVAEPERVVEFARNLLTRYPLRAADAIQLASAIAAVEESQEAPSSLPFVTLDGDLAAAAHEEGFPVLP